jgi:hypothetical protein
MRTQRLCDHPAAAMTDRFGDVAWCRWCGPIDVRTRRILPGALLERLGDRVADRLRRGRTSGRR